MRFRVWRNRKQDFEEGQRRFRIFDVTEILRDPLEILKGRNKFNHVPVRMIGFYTPWFGVLIRFKVKET